MARARASCAQRAEGERRPEVSEPAIAAPLAADRVRRRSSRCRRSRPAAGPGWARRPRCCAVPPPTSARARPRSATRSSPTCSAIGCSSCSRPRACGASTRCPNTRRASGSPRSRSCSSTRSRPSSRSGAATGPTICSETRRWRATSRTSSDAVDSGARRARRARARFEAFAWARRLGHRLGLGSWAGAEAASPRYLDRLVPLFDRLDTSDSFVRPWRAVFATRDGQAHRAPRRCAGSRP